MKILHTISTNVAQNLQRNGGNIAQKAAPIVAVPLVAAGVATVNSAITAGTASVAGGASIASMGATMTAIASAVAASPAFPVIGAAALVGGVVWGVASLFDN